MCKMLLIIVPHRALMWIKWVNISILLEQSLAHRFLLKRFIKRATK